MIILIIILSLPLVMRLHHQTLRVFWIILNCRMQGQYTHINSVPILARTIGD